MTTGKNSLILFLFLILLVSGGCASNPSSESNDDQGSGGVVVSPLNVLFNPIGAALAFNLIDLEFLPGQNGELLVVAKDGTVYYLDANFNLIATNADLVTEVKDDGERGMQGLVADPNYANNKMVYFYYTRNISAGDEPVNDVNRVERRTISLSNGVLTLEDAQVMIEFPKSESPNPGHNHNGGGMVFDPVGNLILGVGDGGGNSSADTNLEISQDPNVKLGKIHRIVPSTTPGVGGFTNPTEPADDLNEPNAMWPSIYAYGVRNPFTMAGKGKNDQLFGDVGSQEFEELNCLYNAGENYGWPHFEGFGGLPDFEPAAHGYAHGDRSFADDDPEANPSGPLSIMVLAFIEGITAYGDDGLLFDRRVVYADFYEGWVRAMKVEANHIKSDDTHIGHLEGMTSLQFNPTDGFYYAVSLFGSNQILRMELAE